MNDWDLIKRWAEARDEQAFAELVGRNVDLVFSAALRQVNGDQHLAKDVVQSVFTDLARKAHSLSPRVVLSGWLYTSTRFAAAKAVRTEQRRREREQKAGFMDEPGDSGASPDWEQLQTVLDEAMHDLNERDRNAVLLRYFEGRNLSEVGERLGVSTDAARMRVERALDKLRALIGKRGVASTSGALALLLSQQALTAAPAGLAVTVASSAAGAAATSGIALTVFQFMAMTKIKAGALAVAVAGMSVPLVLQYQSNQELERKNQALSRQYAQAAADIIPLKDEVERLNALVAEKAQTTDRSNEVYRLRAEVSRLRQEARDAAQNRAIEAAAPGEDPVQETLRTLGLRAAQLKNHLARVPDKYIPELQFVSEKDWLDAVSNLETLESDSDYRRALNNLRSSAKQKFGSQLQAALRKYAEANGDRMPADIHQLQPYFQQPVDPSLLQRYQVAHNEKYSESPDGQALISEIATPVDQEYDTLFSFHRNGTSSRSYNAVGAAIQAAAEAYAQANQGLLPRKPEQLSGYLQPGIESAKIAQFLARIPPNITTLEELKNRD